MSAIRIPKNAFRVRIKSINEMVRIVGARVIASGKVFDVVDGECRPRTFLAHPGLFDVPAVELLAEWERLSVKGKKIAKAKLEPWEKALTESRNPRDTEDAATEPVELETIVARGRDDIESEPEPDVDAEPLEEFETISAADATVPLSETEEFEEMDLEEFEDALYGED